MSIDIQKLTVKKRPDHLRFQGRTLYLLDDAELMRRQLNGEDLELTDELRAKLRDQISTDEITPAYICYYFDETLGEFPYLGFRAGQEFPVARGLVKKGGFVCSVSGKRRGKGSSREQSPYAELMAGVRVVIAENIERIYNENCQNLGVLSSTDFSLIERIRAGEEIELSEFTKGQDEITKDIIEYGGLFEYNVARLQGKVVPPMHASVGTGGLGDWETGRNSQDVALRRGAGERATHAEIFEVETAGEQTSATSQPNNQSRPIASSQTPPVAPKGMTISEKIFARHWVVDAANAAYGVPWVRPGDSGFVVTDYRFSH